MADAERTAADTASAAAAAPAAAMSSTDPEADRATHLERCEARAASEDHALIHAAVALMNRMMHRRPALHVREIGAYTRDAQERIGGAVVTTLDRPVQCRVTIGILSVERRGRHSMLVTHG